MICRIALVFVSALLAPVWLAPAQLLDQAKLAAPLGKSWPTYNGDYTGQRFSSLSQINSENVKSLVVGWKFRADVGRLRGIGGTRIKSTPLMVNGVLYFTVPDHVWAVDALTGKELWHYTWADQGGHLVGNRGVGMYEKLALFFGSGRLVYLAQRERRQRTLAGSRSRREIAVLHHHGPNGGA